MLRSLSGKVFQRSKTHEWASFPDEEPSSSPGLRRAISPNFYSSHNPGSQGLISNQSPLMSAPRTPKITRSRSGSEVLRKLERSLSLKSVSGKRRKSAAINQLDVPRTNSSDHWVQIHGYGGSGYMSTHGSQPTISPLPEGDDDSLAFFSHFVAEFSQRLATTLEANAFQLQSLMDSYRSTHEQFLQERVECPMHILNAWEVLTKEFDQRAEQDISLAKFLASEVSVPLYDLVQSKKQINKKSAKDEIDLAMEHQEELLNKVQKQYNEVYSKYKTAVSKSQSSTQAPGLQHVHNTHNAYVLQLKAMTAWLKSYSDDILPLVSQENEKSNEELIFQLDRIFSREANLLSDHYNNGLRRMQSIHEVAVGNSRPKKTPKNNAGWKKERSFEFMKPDACCNLEFMKNELAFNEDTEAVLKRKYYALVKEANNLELNIERFKTEMESLNKVRESYTSGTSEKLLAKTAEELNGDIAQKQAQIREQTCQLSAVREQLLLFKPAEWWPDDAEQELQLSTKTKHILEQKFSMFDHSERSHAFVEYTFKKLTYCDYCRNLLRGIVKQGLKCKYCKMAVHTSCSENASYCTRQPKITPHGWRTERSKSMFEEIDPVFNAIRYASTLSSNNRTESISSNGSGSSSHHQKRESADLGYRTDSRSPSRFNSGTTPSSTGTSNSLFHQSSSPNFAGSRDPGAVGGGGAGPHSQLMLPTNGNHGSEGVPSPEAKFSNESCDSLHKSSSTGSRSPPPSPRIAMAPKRGMRGTQYCLVTRDFIGSKQDDLPIKRGDVVTIVAQDGHDWIRGVSNGLEGYFPESFVIIPGPDDYLMRVTHTYSGTADSADELSLTKDQIVVFQGEEQPGWCYVKTQYNESGVFPLCYLTKYR